MDTLSRTSSVPPEQESGSDSKAFAISAGDILFSLILVVLFAASVCCYRYKRRDRRVQPSNQAIPREEKKRRLAKRKEEIKEHLKVYAYSAGEKATVDESMDDIDIEAQEGKKEGSHSTEPTGMENDEACKAECAVCLCPFESGQMVCDANNASCIHSFHETCMMAWLLKHRECPICRQNYLDIEDPSKAEEE